MTQEELEYAVKHKKAIYANLSDKYFYVAIPGGELKENRLSVKKYVQLNNLSHVGQNGVLTKVVELRFATKKEILEVASKNVISLDSLYLLHSSIDLYPIY